MIASLLHLCVTIKVSQDDGQFAWIKGGGETAWTREAHWQGKGNYWWSNECFCCSKPVFNSTCICYACMHRQNAVFFHRSELLIWRILVNICKNTQVSQCRCPAQYKILLLCWLWNWLWLVNHDAVRCPFLRLAHCFCGCSVTPTVTTRWPSTRGDRCQPTSCRSTLGESDGDVVVFVQLRESGGASS